MRLPELGERASHVPDVSPLEWVKVSISFIKDIHSQNPPVILETRCRINSLVVIQCPLPEDLKVRHLGLLEEIVGFVA